MIVGSFLLLMNNRSPLCLNIPTGSAGATESLAVQAAIPEKAHLLHRTGNRDVKCAGTHPALASRTDLPLQWSPGACPVSWGSTCLWQLVAFVGPVKTM